MIRKLARFFLSMKLMTQVFLLNAAVLFLALAALGTLAFSSLWSSYLENELAFNSSAVLNLRDYFLDKEDFAFKTSREGLNQVGFAGDQGFRYLELLDEGEDRNSTAADYSKVNLIRYMEHRFGSDSHLTAILLYSPLEDAVYPFTRMGSMVGQVDRETAAAMAAHLDKTYLTVTLCPATQESYSAVPSYSLLLNLRSTGSYHTMGVLKHDFSVQSVTDYLDRYYTGVKGRFVAAAGDGGVLYDSGGELYGELFFPPELVLRGKGVFATPDGQYYVNVESSPHLDLRVYGIISRQELMWGFASTLFTLAAIFLAVFVFFLAATYSLNRRRSRQIEGITEVMRKTRGGDLSFRVPISRSRNELSYIGESYNDTLDHLEDFIHSAYVSELSKRQFQLLALRAQINPHFLYNTLEVIRMKALSSGAREAAEMTYILARLFRNSVKSSPFTTVAEEIEGCKDYLRLHEIRSVNNLSYEFQVEREAQRSGVIRHMLQPLVENYVLHGFEITRGDNFIHIQARLEGDNLVFTLQDNGKGITSEQLEELHARMEELPEVPMESIGIINIHQRIRLIYGPEYGIAVESGGQGALVTVRVRNQTVEELTNSVQGFTGG